MILLLNNATRTQDHIVQRFPSMTRMLKIKNMEWKYANTDAAK